MPPLPHRQRDNAKNKSPVICLNLQSKGEVQHLPCLTSRTVNLSFTRRSFLKRRIYSSTYKIYEEEKVWFAGSKGSLCTHGKAHQNGLTPESARFSFGGHGAKRGPLSLGLGGSCKLHSPEQRYGCEHGGLKAGSPF